MKVDVFKPSQANLNWGFPPLVGTFKKTEAEVAASLMVRACVLGGDVWQAVTPSDIVRAIQHDIDGKINPIFDMSTNPFCRPDFDRLVKDGYAEFSGDPESEGRPIAFTQVGLEAMSKWTRDMRVMG